ncbi:TonB family protein [Oligoflexaceae bacterium]|nr:TonB family protein [Oligoflexaceae bacterium]
MNKPIQNAAQRSRKAKKRFVYPAFLVGSLLLHFLVFVNISYFLGDAHSPNQPKKEAIKVRYVEKRPDQQKSDKNRQVVETPMSKTEKPKDADYLGAQDHIAKKQTKVEKPNNTALKTGPKGTPQKQSPKKATPQKKPKLDIARTPQKKGTKKSQKRNPIDSIEDLLPTANEMFGQLDAGFQDYIDDNLENGDVVDLNTTNFRFLGYVSHLRQEIQLVWNYPQEAASRGLEGKVGLQFRILKDGTTDQVTVVESSGYTSLDKAIVSAIKLASPFAPLPDDVVGDSKVFAGVFHYSLCRFCQAH